MDRLLVVVWKKKKRYKTGKYEESGWGSWDQNQDWVQVNKYNGVNHKPSTPKARLGGILRQGYGYTNNNEDERANVSFGGRNVWDA